MITRSTLAALAVLIFALGSSSCARLDPATLIKDARILGAKITVDGDATNALPRPGQQMNVTFAVADVPDRELDGEAGKLYWTVGTCAANAARGVRGAPPACAGPAGAGMYAGEGASPSFALLTPDADYVLAIGILCQGGPVAPVTAATNATNPLSIQCAPQATLTIRFTYVVTLDRTGAQVNRNPDLTGVELLLDQMPWSGTACVSVPRDGAKHTLSVRVPSAAQEMFTAGTVTSSEEWIVAHYATDGELARSYSAFANGLGSTRFGEASTLEWTAPKTGTDRIDFWFVFRDGRGGFDVLLRSVCAP